MMTPDNFVEYVGLALLCILAPLVVVPMILGIVLIRSQLGHLLNKCWFGHNCETVPGVFVHRCTRCGETHSWGV